MSGWSFPEGLYHASFGSPCHLSAKHCFLRTCLPRTTPFRAMLLTLRGGPQCLDPRAHGVPVHLTVYTFLDCASRRRPVYPEVITTFLHNASRRTRRAMHASCESPWHSLAKHHLLGACFPRMVPFRSMLLTLRGGPQCLAPRAHRVPVYPMVFSTFLYRAFTAHIPVAIAGVLIAGIPRCL